MRRVDRIAIFDLDGVIFEIAPENQRHIDWSDVEGCTALMRQHKPVESMIDLANSIRHNTGIVLLTGRPEIFRAVTGECLHNTHLVWDRLIMRPMDMLHLHDLDVKRMALSDLREKYSIWFAVEDRAAVVKMWREEGIMCLQNCEGNY